MKYPKIKATKMTDKSGQKGYFITTEDWQTILKILYKKFPEIKSQTTLWIPAQLIGPTKSK